MKKIGFLSFGHGTLSSQSETRSAADALLQSIELAVAAEDLGADRAYFRLHHFARRLASPFPLLAAAGARTRRIEIGTAVIDMRYENPLYMIEDQLGVACNTHVIGAILAHVARSWDGVEVSNEHCAFCTNARCDFETTANEKDLTYGQDSDDLFRSGIGQA